MIKTVYIDTNIFMNIFLDEEKYYQSSRQLFIKLENEELRGVISIFTLMEICRVLQKNRFLKIEINNIISKIKELKLKIVVPSEFQLTIAYDLLNELKIDVLDVLHLAVAIAESDVFITRDEKLADKIKHKIPVKIPEQI